MVGPVGLEPKDSSSENPAKAQIRENNQAVTNQNQALPGEYTSQNHALFMQEDLAQVVEAWGRLPEALKAGIVAMVKASKGE